MAARIPRDTIFRPQRIDASDGGSLHDILQEDVRKIAGAPRGDGPETSNEGPDLETSLRALSPRPVPSLVLSLAGTSPSAVSTMLSAIPGQLDDRVARYPVKIELRLDTLSSFGERVTAAGLVLQLGVPVILTLRARNEGGQTTLTEPERQRLFLSLVSALRKAPPPGSLIDLEASAVAMDPEGWGQVIAQAREKGLLVLLSYHDLDETPERAQALLPPAELLSKTPGGGALAWKSATRVNTWSQEMAILRALRRGNRNERRVAVMGIGTPTSRLVAPFFGAPLVYASVDNEHAAAPGQVPFAALVHAWARWGVDVDDMALAATAEGEDGPLPQRWCLLGRPAWQSLSPAMHNAAARADALDARYFPLEIPAHTGGGSALDAFESTLRGLPALGVVAGNVTVPFKAALAQVADQRDERVERLGAANCYRFDGDQLLVTNTDVEGVAGSLAEADSDPAGRTVLVLGAGGAAPAAVMACGDAERVIVVNRTRDHADALVARLQEHVKAELQAVDWSERDDVATDADIVVHATPLGLASGPAPDESALSGSALREGQTVLEMVYEPAETPLVRTARAQGATVIEGTSMLLHQAAAAYAWWTGREAPLVPMRLALAEAEKVPFPQIIRDLVATSEVEA